MKNNTNDGFIFIILLLIIYIIVMKKIHKEKEKLNLKNSYIPPTQTSQTIYFKNFYEPKRYLITKNELNFYRCLIEVASELNLVVFSQVSLYNILHTKNGLDHSTNQKYFNKIAAKSIDFVLTDPNDCRIKLCIELDDTTHKLLDRVERDNFINELFRQLEINL